MQVSIISDIHVRDNYCEGGNFLYKFLDEAKLRGDTDIILLGDIFDFMVGSYPEYQKIFSRLFQKIEDTLNEKINIYYLEGNHDFHIKNLFQDYFKAYDHFQFYVGPFSLKVNGIDYLFCHGDEIELNNIPHHVFRRFTKSKFAENVLLKVINHKYLTTLGNFLSEKSRSLGEKQQTPQILEKIKQNSRKSAFAFAKKNEFSRIICGHSHIKDIVEIDGILYANNGFATREKTFISLQDQNVKFERLL